MWRLGWWLDFMNVKEIIKAINNINGPDNQSIKLKPSDLGFNKANSP